MKQNTLFLVLGITVTAALAGLAAVILFVPRATEDQPEPEQDESGDE